MAMWFRKAYESLRQMAVCKFADLQKSKHSLQPFVCQQKKPAAAKNKRLELIKNEALNFIILVSLYSTLSS